MVMGIFILKKLNDPYLGLNLELPMGILPVLSGVHLERKNGKNPFKAKPRICPMIF